MEIDTNGNKIVTVGPLTCANKMLNACKGECMPKLRISKKLNYTPNPQKTFRYLGKTDFDLIEEGKNTDENLKLAYYDSEIKKEDWNSGRSKYYENRLKTNK